MADDNSEPKGVKNEGQMEIKVEPTLQYYVEEEHENGFTGFENVNAIPSSADVGALNLWTSKATTCLIGQYKKYRSMVGQSTQLRSLREMFEMISLEMQNYGFYFSPQKCENKWRVLERKYKNLIFRERLKKPGRMRHYGHWEHRRALDEIFNDKKRHMYEYLEEGDFADSGNPNQYTVILPRPTLEQESNVGPTNQQHDDLLGNLLTNAASKRSEEAVNQKSPLAVLLEKFVEETARNFALAEKNKERRHQEKMAIRQSELEVMAKLLKLKEQKVELEKSRMIAAAQHLHMTMQWRAKEDTDV